MSLSASEKLEVIRIAEESELSVRRTLRELDVSRSSFYRRYRQYGRWTEGIGAGLPIPSAFLQPDPGSGEGTLSGGCPAIP